MKIHCTGVQYMRKNPERFIENSADHSCLSYLVYMAHQGTWAHALVIQSVGDALNLTVHIIESNPGFASVINISPVRSETDTAVLNTGHLDEIHCVPTVPFNQSTTEEAPQPNYLDPKCTADSLIFYIYQKI